MGRLVEKGLLAVEAGGRAGTYRPTIDRDRYLEQRSAAELHGLVDRYGDVALVHFARELARLDPARQEELRRLARDPER